MVNANKSALSIEHKKPPIELFDFILRECEDCQDCDKRATESISGGNGCCKIFYNFTLMYIPDLTEMEKYVIKFETEKRNSSILKRQSEYVIF